MSKQNTLWYLPIGSGVPSARHSSLSLSPSSSSTTFGNLSLNVGGSPGGSFLRSWAIFLARSRAMSSGVGLSGLFGLAADEKTQTFVLLNQHTNFVKT